MISLPDCNGFGPLCAIGKQPHYVFKTDESPRQSRSNSSARPIENQLESPVFMHIFNAADLHRLGRMATYR
jgi:hypothetical protein